LGVLEDQIIFCYPNSDAGSYILIERTRDFLKQRDNGHLFINLDALTYWSLLRQVQIMVGNSSSGIMETPSFALPTVNVGFRQKGRERAANIIDASANKAEILARIATARSPGFRESLEGMRNPYGDGEASQKIVEVLTTAPLGDQLLIKAAR